MKSLIISVLLLLVSVAFWVSEQPYWYAYPFLILAIIKSRGDLIFYTLLLIYGWACSKNLLPSHNLLVVIPILLMTGISRNDTPRSRILFIGFALAIYALPFWLYRDSIQFYGWGYLELFEPWELIGLLASLAISLALIWNLNSEKYLKVSNSRGDKKLEVYTNTSSYVPFVLFSLPLQIFIMWSDSSDERFLSLSYLASYLVIGISIYGIVSSLIKYSERCKIILHSSGKISSPGIGDEKSVRIWEKQYKIADLRIEHSPEAMAEFVAKQRKGDVYFAGGSGPEGSALFAGSAAMTIADGTIKAGKGFGELAGVAMANYQKLKNSWYLIVRLTSEDNDDSVLIIPDVREQVAKSVQKLLSEQRTRNGNPSIQERAESRDIDGGETTRWYHVLVGRLVVLVVVIAIFLGIAWVMSYLNLI